ncbi:MAG TPA: nickel transporter permease [Gemmatimonadaceae bacterium]|nr:nickel transporter permease [Nitrolancea sp.]
MSIQDTAPRYSPAAQLSAEGSRVKSRTGLRYFLRSFSSDSPLNIVALVIIAIFLLMSLLGPTLAPYDPIKPNILVKFHAPSTSHLFGTDELGRDVLSRVMSGARISLGIACLILSIAVTAGIIVGAIAGYVGGLVDELLMRVTDVFLAFPALILAMAIAATLGRDITNVVIALTVVYWPWYARLVRSQVIAIKERDYVEAARSVGARSRRILLRHILPNSIAPVIIQLTIDVGYAVLATAGLSFLGLGAQPPSPEWGAMIAGARAYFRDAWWYITFPGLALTFTVVAFNLLGDGLRDYLDPRTRGR